VSAVCVVSERVEPDGTRLALGARVGVAAAEGSRRPGAAEGEVTMYIVIDVGCIDCGSKSGIVGTFETEDEANLAENEATKKLNWWDGGQHNFHTFEIQSACGITAEYAKLFEEKE
jgi:hypothetical protein